ncbi:MAG: hypothetical protein KatS3mg060_2301 [Dehalococcoidia bacterium]|nr:MAG: hypothetical protein KatS3mg060_2301 [Dehalococcoidia bacterium]
MAELMNAASRALAALAMAAFVAAVPLVIVLSVVRLLVFDPDYYRRGYERHGVAATAGMTRAQLDEATAQVQAYFRGGPTVSLVVRKEWGRELLFNQREQQHLADVRDLLTLAPPRAAGPPGVPRGHCGGAARRPPSAGCGDAGPLARGRGRA